MNISYYNVSQSNSTPNAGWLKTTYQFFVVLFAQVAEIVLATITKMQNICSLAELIRIRTLFSTNFTTSNIVAVGNAMNPSSLISHRLTTSLTGVLLIWDDPSLDEWTGMAISLVPEFTDEVGRFWNVEESGTDCIVLVVVSAANCCFNVVAGDPIVSAASIYVVESCVDSGDWWYCYTESSQNVLREHLVELLFVWLRMLLENVALKGLSVWYGMFVLEEECSESVWWWSAVCTWEASYIGDLVFEGGFAETMPWLQWMLFLYNHLNTQFSDSHLESDPRLTICPKAESILKERTFEVPPRGEQAYMDVSCLGSDYSQPHGSWSRYPKRLLTYSHSLDAMGHLRLYGYARGAVDGCGAQNGGRRDDYSLVLPNQTPLSSSWLCADRWAQWQAFLCIERTVFILT